MEPSRRRVGGLCPAPPRTPSPVRDPAVQRLPIIGQPVLPTPSRRCSAPHSRRAASDQIEHWERKPHQLAESIRRSRGAAIIGALIAAPHKERAAALVGASRTTPSRAARSTSSCGRTAAARAITQTSTACGQESRRSCRRCKASGPSRPWCWVPGGGARAVVSVLIGSGFRRDRGLQPASASGRSAGGSFRQERQHMDLRAMPWHETIIEASCPARAARQHDADRRRGGSESHSARCAAGGPLRARPGAGCSTTPLMARSRSAAGPRPTARRASCVPRR